MRSYPLEPVVLAIRYYDRHMIETYTGGCHCKEVRYEVSLDLAPPVLECNCSHCEKKGMLLSFVPAEAFTFTEGEDKLTEYRFNTEKIAHVFCARCGVQPIGRAVNKEGAPTIAVNVRTIDGIDLTTLTRMPIDGKSF